MSYETQSLLASDGTFQRRVTSVNIQQADYFKDSAAADMKNLAYAVLRGEPDPGLTLLNMAAAGPGVADKVDLGDGTIDQSLVTDDDLLALTQANWPTVAALYFNADGTPIGGTSATI